MSCLASLREVNSSLGSITDACRILTVCLKQHSAKNYFIVSHMYLGVASLHNAF